ncbi:UDP-N-acetylmuramoyl-L-alanine--D-glutamate ligase [Williamsia maris]|uniref:UDP-N-acetylmuramoylalanine--D-glutamate ligase n=1 Tax=Williamsia maris TaxID=72806 RepID=A0ABT1HGW0_9NOCA|nr:UDP-N-acetylmuramoyl-L-alanine--D-glutamate ligase [Williamsia maris]MCP2176960.1 UDP-N-acetylmuramoylalanine--D-glutamate ligase [Williamsia maris]
MAAVPASDQLPSLPGLRVLVAGAGTAGVSAALFLAAHDARVTVCDGRTHPRPVLADAGVEVISTDSVTRESVTAFDLVVVSPGFRPDSAVVTAARSAGLPVWGEVELAWRVDHSGLLGAPRTWLVITGTNGKTTTTSMVEAVVAASPRSVAACGNIGLPVLDALTLDPRVDVLAVELSSFQLYWAPSVVPDAGVVLNIAEDHLDWHGSMGAYVTAKSGALRGQIAIVGADDPVAGALSATTPGARTVAVRLGEPAVGEVGVVGGDLVDRAFGGDAGVPVGTTASIRPVGPSGLTDALAAAALCRAVGVTADDVERGLAGFRPGRHRGEVVATLEGIEFVDDSKATNPHAAAASIRAHRRVVLIAGGLLKGAAVDDLVVETADRLAAVVLLGTDRDLLAAAIARHAPSIPTVTLLTGDDDRVIATPVLPDAVADSAHSPSTSTDALRAITASAADPALGTAGRVMNAAVAIAWHLAAADIDRPDAILLAPAAASLDMFSGYGERGDAFAHGALAVGATAPLDDGTTAS